MKAKGQARLELRGNPGCASLDLCTCATGCTVHMVGGDETSKGTRGGHRDGASTCFAACMVLCFLVAALHPWEAPLLSAARYAATKPCLAHLPPAVQRASAHHRC